MKCGKFFCFVSRRSEAEAGGNVGSGFKNPRPDFREKKFGFHSKIPALKDNSIF